MLTPGYATTEGTLRFRDRFAAGLPDHFSLAHGLWLSSIGIGTYAEDENVVEDGASVAVLAHAVRLGTNVIDSALSYRRRRSERSIGEMIRRMVIAGELNRDEIFIATKGGFVAPTTPNSEQSPPALEALATSPEGIVAACHTIDPTCLRDQINESRTNLGIDVIDLYYLHNPEFQLMEISQADFADRLAAAFEELEKACASGTIRMYGTATWRGYLVDQGSRDAISLAQTIKIAEDVGGKESHHFRAIQVPFNLGLPEALCSRTQVMDGEPVSVMELAIEKGLLVFASASLLGGRLTSGLLPQITKYFPGLDTDAQRAIQFARSSPGVTSALVGMTKHENVLENLATAQRHRMSDEDLVALLS